MAIGPAPVAPGTPSKSPASPSRRRGRDLETVFCIKSYAYIAFVQTTELHTQSWKHLAFVQSGILDEPGKEFRV